MRIGDGNRARGRQAAVVNGTGFTVWSLTGLGAKDGTWTWRLEGWQKVLEGDRGVDCK